MQRQGSIVSQTDNGDKEYSGREIAISEQRWPHERFARGEGMHEEKVERRRSDNSLDDDLAGAKPIELFAAIQHDLEGSDREAKHTKAKPVQLRRDVSCSVSQKNGDTEEGEDTDRQVDVEDIAPAVDRGQIAAKHRPEHGTGHNRDAPYRHCASLLFFRINIEQSGLGERDEGGAEQALQDAKQYDLHQ